MEPKPLLRSKKIMRRSFFSSFAVLEWSRRPEKPLFPKKDPFLGRRGGLGRHWLMFAASSSGIKAPATLRGSSSSAFTGLYENTLFALAGAPIGLATNAGAFHLSPGWVAHLHWRTIGRTARRSSAPGHPLRSLQPFSLEKRACRNFSL